MPEKNGFCRSGKCRYTRRKLAARALYEARMRGSQTPLRVYPCTFCGGWHLTSRRPRELTT